MTTSQETSQYFYDLFELGLEEYGDYESIQEIIHNLKNFFEHPTSCTCRVLEKQKDIRTCFEKIGFKKFFQRHFQIINLTNKELDLFLKAQLLAMEIENKNLKSSEKIIQRTNYRFCFNSTYSLCQTAFLMLYNISDHKFKNIVEHLHNEGINERIHGNTGRAPIYKTKVNIDENLKFIVKNFLNQYSLIHGLPSPMRHRNDSGAFIYLPTDKRFISVYKEFKKFYLENILKIESENDLEEEKIISYDSFRRLWNELMPNLKFQPLASDLCDNCVQFKSKLQLAKRNIDEYNNVEAEFNEHKKMANLERDHYNNNIELSKSDLSIAHICYDWAQNVTIPYSPQQAGPLYFLSGYAVHLFGVCKTEGGINKQLNFLIGEDELPQGTSKGANTTLNLVYQALQIFAKNGKKKLHITCDNCSGQNKNNLSLWFWTWIIMLGWYEEITINFMIPGHTKFICDSFFGHIKKLYRNSKVNQIKDIENIINNSSEGNESIQYKNGLGWKWYNFGELFEKKFKTLPNIKQYHHFRFNNLPENKGKVFVSTKSGGEEKWFNLLKDNNFSHNEPINIIPINIDLERKLYLYKKIRNFVEEPHKDVHFSNPDSNEMEIN